MKNTSLPNLIKRLGKDFSKRLQNLLGENKEKYLKTE